MKENQQLGEAEGTTREGLDPASEITRVGRFLSDLYALEFELDGAEYLISPRLARRLLPQPCPRTGVLAIEQAGELQLGVYLDPIDCQDPFVLVEETSHLMCLAWHAAHDRPVSGLLLELQSEIDRFFYFCHDSGDLNFSCFARGRATVGLSGDLQARYDVARERAHRYCRRLVDRFARQRDTCGLARELRRFYRASPSRKLAA